MALEELKAQVEQSKKPRVKAQMFDKFMADHEVTGFVKQEYDDEFRTVGYYSSVTANDQNCKVQVLMNDAIYTYIKILCGYKVVNTENEDKVLQYLNRLNNRGLAYKFVVTAEGSIELDICLIADEMHFDPQMILVMLLQVGVPYLDDELKRLPAVVGTELDVNEPGRREAEEGPAGAPAGN